MLLMTCDHARPGGTSRSTMRGRIQLEILEDRRLLSGGYRYEPLEYIPGPAPNGAIWTFDFEPGEINNRGEAIFAADLSDASGNGIGEGVFVHRGDSLTTLAFPGQAIPGGTYDAFVVGTTSINDRGEGSLALGLEPFTLPIGLNAGVYRRDANSSTLTAVATPGMPAPGGGTFAGAYFNTHINNQGDILFPGIVTGADIDPDNPPGVDGLGVGLFQGNRDGTVISVVRPGDPAPDGRVFDKASTAGAIPVATSPSTPILWGTRASISAVPWSAARAFFSSKRRAARSSRSPTRATRQPGVGPIRPPSTLTSTMRRPRLRRGPHPG